MRAEIVSIDAFSVHADADELMHWLTSCDGHLTHVFVNHGEPDAARTLEQRIEKEMDVCVIIPMTGERVSI